LIEKVKKEEERKAKEKKSVKENDKKRGKRGEWNCGKEGRRKTVLKKQSQKTLSAVAEPYSDLEGETFYCDNDECRVQIRDSYLVMNKWCVLDCTRMIYLPLKTDKKVG